MTVPEIIGLHMVTTGTSKATAGRQWRAAVTTLAMALATAEHVDLPGLGVFRRTTRKARTIRNPVTHELMRLEPGRSISFRPCKALKAEVQ